MSKVNIIKEQIKSKLEIINELANQLLSHDKIPQIDIDLMLEQLRSIYNDFIILNKINSFSNEELFTNLEKNLNVEKSQTISSTNINNDVKSEPVVVETMITKKDDEKEKHPSVEQEIEKNDVESETLVTENTKKIIEDSPKIIIKDENAPQTINYPEQKEVKTPEKEEKNIPSVESEKSKKEKTKSQQTSVLDLFGETTPILADKLKSDKPSLLDKISEQKQDNSLATKMLKQPIKDLKKAIGINEKFQFINELFNGSLDDYNKAIEYLNEKCTNIEEAKDYITKIREEYKWDDAKQSVSIFENLIERRFMNN